MASNPSPRCPRLLSQLSACARVCVCVLVSSLQLSAHKQTHCVWKQSKKTAGIGECLVKLCGDGRLLSWVTNSRRCRGTSEQLTANFDVELLNELRWIMGDAWDIKTERKKKLRRKLPSNWVIFFVSLDMSSQLWTSKFFKAQNSQVLTYWQIRGNLRFGVLVHVNRRSLWPAHSIDGHSLLKVTGAVLSNLSKWAMVCLHGSLARVWNPSFEPWSQKPVMLELFCLCPTELCCDLFVLWKQTDQYGDVFLPKCNKHQNKFYKLSVIHLQTLYGLQI